MASAAPQISPSNGTDLHGAERRIAERLRVLLPGSVTVLDGVFDCAIEDVSISGARFIADVPLKKGQEGILVCPPLEVLFSVVWTDGKTAGVHFEEETSLGTIRALRWHNDRFRSQHEEKLGEIVRDWAASPSG